MRTKKILGLLFLFTLIVFSSCKKHDRPAELSIDVQSLEFDNTVLNRKFNVTNIGDDPLFVEASSDQNWISIIGDNVSLSHAQTSVISVQIDSDYFQEYGTYTGNLFLHSNGGDFTIPITVYLPQPAGPLLALDLDYLKFPTSVNQDYFMIYNDGNENMNFSLQTLAPWIEFSQTTGTVIPNGEKRIDVYVNRSGLSAGIYSAAVNINSNGGSAVLDVDMDVLVYSITFFNPVYTPIAIQSPGFDPAFVEAGERFSFVFPNNPLNFAYSASTSGETNDGFALGIEILWDEIIDVSNDESPTFNLNVSADYFFMAVKNTGNYNLTMWSINYDTDYQIDEDLFIPNDGLEYGVAYYDAFEDTDIYARLDGTDNDVVWSQGIEFVFPWIENQYILLENNFKKSSVKRSVLKASSAQQKRVKTFKHAVKKSKGSIDLYNKK